MKYSTFAVKAGQTSQSGNMAEASEVLLFGDETSDSREPLQKLCERQRGVVFVHFIDKLNEVLREEVRRQPRHVKEQIPPFTDVLDLVKRYQDSTSRNPLLETTLACIFQLGSVVRYIALHTRSGIQTDPLPSFFQDHPSQYIIPSNTVLVGLCTGLLAAAAVSASQNVLDLIANALNIVRVAFRIGVKVNGAAERLSATRDAEVSQSWSRLVVGAQKDASISEVAQFNKTQVRSFTDVTLILSAKLTIVLGPTES